MADFDPNKIQQGPDSEAVEAYDKAHGKFQQNVPRDGGPPNTANGAGQAAPNPSPFKLGPT